METAAHEAKEEKYVYTWRFEPSQRYSSDYHSFYHYTRTAVGVLLDEYSVDRNAMCAGMLLLSGLHTGAEEGLADMAFEYFKTYGHKTFCFHDLQPYICAMEIPVVQRFLLKVRTWLEERGYRTAHLGQVRDKVSRASIFARC